jgi:hypothetical protein
LASARTLVGFVDLLTPERAAGWVWNEADPSEPLSVKILHGDKTLARADARKLRPDLAKAGIGSGEYSFEVTFEPPLPPESLRSMAVEVAGTSFRLPILPSAYEDRESFRDSQLNVYNFARMRAVPPSRFGHIRFDPNNDCNLHCVYCHNPRSKQVIATEDFRAFIHENVLETHFFQMGCVMEPTLDPRLADLLLLVGESPAKPRVELLLQTNGILLFRHDHGKLRDAGLTALSVSVDAAEPSTQKVLRNGTSLDKVLRNVAAFRTACPDTRVEFITTVTRANVDKIEALIAHGLNIGVGKFVLREVFYYPENDIVDHERMPELVLRPGEFDSMRDRVNDRFGRSVEIAFADVGQLGRHTEKMTADSLG